MINVEARAYGRYRGIPNWMIAKYYGVSEMTIIRRLRTEFTPDQLEEWKNTVDKIAAEKELNAGCKPQD